MDMNEATAKAIGAERAISGLTVRELSARTGIPMSSLMRVLQAEREIKVNQVAKIAAAFELYPHEIIEHAERLIERDGPRKLVLLPDASEMSDLDGSVYDERDMLAARDDDDDAEAEAQQEEP